METQESPFFFVKMTEFHSKEGVLSPMKGAQLSAHQKGKTHWSEGSGVEGDPRVCMAAVIGSSGIAHSNLLPASRELEELSWLQVLPARVPEPGTPGTTQNLLL